LDGSKVITKKEAGGSDKGKCDSKRKSQSDVIAGSEYGRGPPHKEGQTDWRLWKSYRTLISQNLLKEDSLQKSVRKTDSQQLNLF
jgi:hypothetical protein